MMDAVEFFKQRIRMCDSFGYCKDCRIGALKGGRQCFSWCWSNPEEAIGAVEQWVAEHPIKTRQSEFLKQSPEARIGDDGVLQIDPCSISASHRNALGNCATMGRECHDCRREFWMQEVEDGSAD